MAGGRRPPGASRRPAGAGILPDGQALRIAGSLTGRCWDRRSGRCLRVTTETLIESIRHDTLFAEERAGTKAAERALVYATLVEDG